jgi:hypothetical protein
VVALAAVGVLVEVRAVEVGEPVLVGGKCEGTQSRMTPMPLWWRTSMRHMRSWGVPQRLVGAKYPVVWYPHEP